MSLSAEQMAERLSGIGSSDIAALVGLSPWAAPIDVWLSKTMRTGPLEDRIEFQVGHVLEQLVADLYSKRTTDRVVDPQKTYRSTTHPFALATPDRLVLDDNEQPVRAVECKVALYAHGFGDEGTDEIPPQYICQTQWQMDVLGIEHADVAALVGYKLKVYHLRRDPELCANLRAAAEHFWTTYVLADVQPPVDGSDGTARYLADKFAEQRAGLAMASTSDDELAERLEKARVALKHAEYDAALIANQMRERIGEHEGILGASWKATWKRSKDSRKIDWESIARELCIPATVIEKHTSVQPGSRRFVFKTSQGE